MDPSNTKRDTCIEFIQVVGLILDNEATREQEEFAEQHIEICTGCFEHYEVERQIKELIRTKLSKKPVPIDLAESIRSQIHLLHD